jgi:hypothetical protein
VEFNNAYLARLRDWELLTEIGCPLTRTNVAPSGNPPATAALTGFSYTVPSNSVGTFVLSGVPEILEGHGYPKGIIRPGERDPAALDEKSDYVVRSVAARASALGVVWDASTAVHLYSVHDLSGLVLGSVIDVVGFAPTHGMTWHRAAPPIIDLELEIDIRRYRAEIFC